MALHNIEQRRATLVNNVMQRCKTTNFSNSDRIFACHLVLLLLLLLLLLSSLSLLLLVVVVVLGLRPAADAGRARERVASPQAEKAKQAGQASLYHITYMLC